MDRDPHEADRDQDAVRCPECGAKFVVDEREAGERGYVLCPRGHRVEVMQGLL